MEKLFAPWRMEYVRSGDDKGGGCIFCDKPREPDRRASLIVHCDDAVLVMLNRYPYNSGHLMVVPRTHAATLDAVPEAEFGALFEIVRRATGVLQEVYHPDGFNIGMNLGRAAGAGIDQHLHVHVVPRWNGDTNFMPVLAETKVISEHLLAAWDSLNDKFSG